MDQIATVLILLLASTVQGSVGFGMALLAVPLLVGTGMPLPSAVPLVMTGSFLNAAFGAVRLRKNIPWKEVATALCVRLVGLTFGIFLLLELAQLDPKRVKTVLGIVVLSAVLFQVLGRNLPQTWVLKAKIPSFFLSGLTHASVGMGGPFMVLWLMATDWAPNRVRGFLFACYSLSLPVAVGLVIAKVGKPAADAALVGLAFFPVSLLGAFLGGKIGANIPRERLRWFVFGLLILVGVSAVVSGT